MHIKHESHREKGRNCVFFMYTILWSEYARMQDFVSNIKKKSERVTSPKTWGPVQIQI